MDKHKQTGGLDRSFTIAIGLFSGTLALLVFLQSAIFSLSAVDVTGNVYLRDSDVVAIADITFGTSIFDIDVRRAKERLVNHPQIEDAVIRRRLPATLEVAITEREPMAMIPTEDGFAILDREGRVLRVVEEIRLPLPLLIGSQRNDLAPGTLVTDVVVQSGLRVAAALKPDLVATISEIQVDGNNIELLTRDLIKIQFGAASQIEDKLTTLRAVMKSLANDNRTVERIDLRVPRAPVIR